MVSALTTITQIPLLISDHNQHLHLLFHPTCTAGNITFTALKKCSHLIQLLRASKQGTIKGSSRYKGAYNSDDSDVRSLLHVLVTVFEASPSSYRWHVGTNTRIGHVATLWKHGACSVGPGLVQNGLDSGLDCGQIFGLGCGLK